MLSEEAKKRVAAVRGKGWYYCGLSVKGQFEGAVKVFKGIRGTVAVIFTLREAYVIVTNTNANITLTAAAIKKNVIQSSKYDALNIDMFENIDVLAEWVEEEDNIEIADNEVWKLYGIDKQGVKDDVVEYLQTLVDLNKFADAELEQQIV